MNVGRREFVTASALGLGYSALGSGHWALGFASVQSADIEAIFHRSIVIDALSADEDWNNPDPIFDAYRKAGVTAIHTSLANRNLTVAMRDLAEWQSRFERWPERLVKIVRGDQIEEAKKTGRVGVLLGFQNATIVERHPKPRTALPSGHPLHSAHLQLAQPAR
jgi:hypothetical protein